MGTSIKCEIWKASFPKLSTNRGSLRDKSRITELLEVPLFDFNGAYGLKLNEKNRWIKKAKMIPWEEIEEKYKKLFPNNIGNVAKPLRMALGSLLIQKQYNFSDVELVNEIIENPYLQYFIGLKKFTNEKPFAPSLLVEFRKRLDEDTLRKH